MNYAPKISYPFLTEEDYNKKNPYTKQKFLEVFMTNERLAMLENYSAIFGNYKYEIGTTEPKEAWKNLEELYMELRYQNSKVDFVANKVGVYWYKYLFNNDWVKLTFHLRIIDIAEVYYLIFNTAAKVPKQPAAISVFQGLNHWMNKIYKALFPNAKLPNITIHPFTVRDLGQANLYLQKLGIIKHIIIREKLNVKINKVIDKKLSTALTEIAEVLKGLIGTKVKPDVFLSPQQQKDFLEVFVIPMTLEQDKQRNDIPVGREETREKRIPGGTGLVDERQIIIRDDPEEEDPDEDHSSDPDYVDMPWGTPSSSETPETALNRALERITSPNQFSFNQIEYNTPLTSPLTPNLMPTIYASSSNSTPVVNPIPLQYNNTPPSRTFSSDISPIPRLEWVPAPAIQPVQPAQPAQPVQPVQPANSPIRNEEMYIPQPIAVNRTPNLPMEHDPYEIRLPENLPQAAPAPVFPGLEGFNVREIDDLAGVIPEERSRNNSYNSSPDISPIPELPREHITPIPSESGELRDLNTPQSIYSIDSAESMQESPQEVNNENNQEGYRPNPNSEDEWEKLAYDIIEAYYTDILKFMHNPDPSVHESTRKRICNYVDGIMKSYRYIMQTEQPQPGSLHWNVNNFVKGFIIFIAKQNKAVIEDLPNFIDKLLRYGDDKDIQTVANYIALPQAEFNQYLTPDTQAEQIVEYTKYFPKGMKLKNYNKLEASTYSLNPKKDVERLHENVDDRTQKIIDTGVARIGGMAFKVANASPGAILANVKDVARRVLMDSIYSVTHPDEEIVTGYKNNQTNPPQPLANDQPIQRKDKSAKKVNLSKALIESINRLE